MSRPQFPASLGDPGHLAEHAWITKQMPFGSIISTGAVNELFDLIDVSTTDDIVIPPGIWNTTSTLVANDRSIRASHHTSTINYIGSGVAIQIGTTGCHHKLPYITHNKAWDSGGSPDRSSIGCRILNANDNIIFLAGASGFYVGLDVRGDVLGSSYNEIHPGIVLDNMVGIRWSIVNAGWSNSNTYVGGRVRISSSSANKVAGSRYLQGTSGGLLGGAGDGNTVIGTTFEANRAEYSVELTANYNTFVGCRWEQASPILLNGSNALYNQIIGGYGSIDDERYGEFYTNDAITIPQNVWVGADGDGRRRPVLLP